MAVVALSVALTGRWLRAVHHAVVTGDRVAAVAAPSATSSPVAEAPTPPPTLAPDASPGLDWATAADVQRPPGMSAEAPSIPPVTGGGLGHPGHFTGQGHLVDVVAGPGGRLVAVGYAFPGWLASAWTSDDGTHWVHHDLGAGEETFLLAVATDGAAVRRGRAGRGGGRCLDLDRWRRLGARAGRPGAPRRARGADDQRGSGSGRLRRRRLGRTVHGGGRAALLDVAGRARLDARNGDRADDRRGPCALDRGRAVRIPGGRDDRARRHADRLGDLDLARRHRLDPVGRRRCRATAA